MIIPFSPPYIDDDIKKEVIDTLDSGWITTGRKVKALEEAIGSMVNVEATMCCNSATSGMMLCLHWFGVKEGDEVIIPAYTYAATALVVMHVGATPVMVDVNSDFNVSVNNIREKITEKTKAIIPVDIAGWPCDYDELQRLINEPRIRQIFRPTHSNQEKLGRIMLLADAAHSFGAYYHDKPIGGWADFTVFSLHAVKNVTTAEGGAICIGLPAPFNNQQIYKQFRIWSLNGQTKDAFTKTTAGGWRYDIIYPGFKINMPDICAAIGLAQIRKYTDLLLPQRKEVFRMYIKLFSGFSWAELPPTDNNEKKSSFHLFALRIKGISESERDEIIDKVMATGVSVNVHFQPLPLLTVFKERGYRIQDFPRSYDNYSREISLPVYPGLTVVMIQFIVNAVADAVNAVVRTKHELPT